MSLIPNWRRSSSNKGDSGSSGSALVAHPHPDCRGITVEQLQAINFDNLDFSNFYEDLQNGSTVPEDNALLQRVQQQIKDQVNNQIGRRKMSLRAGNMQQISGWALRCGIRSPHRASQQARSAAVGGCCPPCSCWPCRSLPPSQPRAQ